MPPWFKTRLRCSRRWAAAGEAKASPFDKLGIRANQIRDARITTGASGRPDFWPADRRPRLEAWAHSFADRGLHWSQTMLPPASVFHSAGPRSRPAFLFWQPHSDLPE